MKKILVTGCSGMIGSHLVKALKAQGHFVVGVDIVHNEFEKSEADFFILQDLTDQLATAHIFKNFQFNEVYNMAAVMGGMEYLANGKCDYEVLNQSTLINWNVLDSAIKNGVEKIFFSSSACVYREDLQMDANVTALKESDAYPSLPDLEYGWQKLITERLWMAGERRNPIKARIARYHNVYGYMTAWQGEKAKAPAAICRKVAMVQDGGSIEVFGDGSQTRSFMAVEDCITGTLKLMESDCNEPINIGSNELIAINDLARMIIDISGKKNITIINNNDKPQGVRGRNSDNTKILATLGWEPSIPLRQGMEKLYAWVKEQVDRQMATQE